jgi:hypothetical protein
MVGEEEREVAEDVDPEKRRRSLMQKWRITGLVEQRRTVHPRQPL